MFCKKSQHLNITQHRRGRGEKKEGRKKERKKKGHLSASD
jgi:hypothetical protein